MLLSTVSVMALFFNVVSPLGSVSILPEFIISDFGDTVTFNCSAQGGPNNTISIVLYHDLDSAIELASGVEETSVTVTNIDTNDGGFYICTVSNLAGTSDAFSTLSVRPYFTTQPVAELHANVNDTANFTCDAGGFPSPSIRWLRVSNSSEEEIVARDPVLIFQSVEFGDEGEYQCVAESVVFNGTNLTEIFPQTQVLVGK